MAGIKANSITKTMVDADTAVNKTVSAYLVSEEIILNTSPTGTTYAWAISKPSGSGARSNLSATSGDTVRFTPDAEGQYLVTVIVNGVTTYDILIGCVRVQNPSFAGALRFFPVANSQIPTPNQGSTIGFSSDLGVMAEKHSDGSVTPLLGAAQQSLRDRAGTVVTPELQIEVFGAKVSKVGGRNRIDLGRFDVREYGAVGNGVTYDDDAFTAALTAIGAAGGGELYIPAGTYLLARQLQGPGANGQLAAGTSIRGASRLCSILVFDFSGTSGVGDGILVCQSTPNQSLTRVWISDLTIRNKSVTNCPRNGIADSGSQVIASSGSSPSITVDWNPYNAYNWTVKLKIQTTGASGTALYMASFDNGANYTSQAITTATTARVIPGVGARVTFPAGTYTANDTYTWTVNGYNGAAIRTTGGGDLVVDRCLFYGWSKGVIDDGGLLVNINDCHFGPGDNPGVAGGGVPYAAQMAVWITGNSYLFGFEDSNNGFSMDRCRIHVLAVGVWHESGNNHSVRDCEFSQGTQYCCLLRNVRSVHWSGNYFEGGGGPPAVGNSGPAENPGRGAHVCSAQGSSAALVTWRNNFVSNTSKIPMVRCYFPSGIGVLEVSGNLVVQSPNGDSGTPTSLIVSTQSISHLRWGHNYISLSGGTVFDAETIYGGLYFSQDTTDTNSMLGVNEVTPGAGIHYRHVATTKPRFSFDTFGGSSERYRLDSTGLLLTHGSGLAADAINQHGYSRQVSKATTVSGSPGPDVSVDFTVPAEMNLLGTVVAGVRSDSAADTWSAWKFRVSTKRFGGNASIVGSDDDAVKLSIATSASPQSYSGGALDGVVGARQASYGRRVTVTTGGGTPSHAPSTATFTGVDINGLAVVEAVSVSQTAAIVTSLKYFASVSQIDLTAGDGTGGTLKFGYDGVRLLDQEIDPSDAGYATPIVRVHSGGAKLETVLNNGSASITGRWAVTYETSQRLGGG